MTIALNGFGWQAAVNRQPRPDTAQATAPQFHSPLVASTTTAQQRGLGSTSQQHAEDAREEAFAKLKIQLQNPAADTRQQGSVKTEHASTALQEFRHFMAKSPAEMIKEKILSELGLSEEEYNALPPERKAKVDEQIAQRMKEDVQMKTQAKIEAQAIPREYREDDDVPDLV